MEMIYKYELYKKKTYGISKTESKSEQWMGKYLQPILFKKWLLSLVCKEYSQIIKKNHELLK